jgi:hypothetical protein
MEHTRQPRVDSAACLHLYRQLTHSIGLDLQAVDAERATLSRCS